MDFIFQNAVLGIPVRYEYLLKTVIWRHWKAFSSSSSFLIRPRSFHPYRPKSILFLGSFERATVLYNVWNLLLA